MRGTQSRLAVTLRRRVELDYLLYPPGAGRKGGRGWPLVLFLHGMGERGRDLALVAKHGPPRLAEAGRRFPFVLVAPQCPLESAWTFQMDALAALVEQVMRKQSIDPGRVYLTGLSMGGAGTWHLAAEHPQAFAAIVPICGRAMGALGFPERVKVLRDLPIWVFHGAQDRVVPMRESKVLVKALREAGSDVRFTVYPKAAHDSWTRTYSNPKLYDWMLKQRNEEFRL